MEIKFVGTGSGQTSLQRYHSSFLINTGGFNLLVDAGDGVSRALLHQKVLYNFIDGVLISHLHPDHYAGLTSLIVQMKMDGRNKPLVIYCHSSNSVFITELIYQSYLFESKLGFKINIKGFNYDRNVKVSDNINFKARANNHLQPNVNYDKYNRLEFSSSSFLFKVKDKNIFFTGDIGSLDDLFIFKDVKFNWMITEITHLSVDELIDAYIKLEPDKVFITHLSKEDEDKVSKLIFQLPAAERRKVISAFDGLNVKI